MSKLMQASMCILSGLFVLTCTVLLLLGDRSYTTKPASASDGLIDPTKVDWLAQRGWKSSEVSIDGFQLGMSRRQAVENAERNHRKLVGLVGGRDEYPCRAERCVVETLANQYVGIELRFDVDAIGNISVEPIPPDANPEVQQAGITRSFVGETKHFFNNYNDAERTMLLGKAESTQTEPNPSGSPIRRVHYKYSKMGLEVSVSLDDRRPNSPFDLSVTLAAPS
jgi:hypothetical protein